MEAMKMRQDEIKQQMFKMMEDGKMKSIKTSFASYSYIAASTQTKFDSKAFKEAVTEEEYNKYLKTSEVKAQLKITIKK